MEELEESRDEAEGIQWLDLFAWNPIHCAAASNERLSHTSAAVDDNTG